MLADKLFNFNVEVNIVTENGRGYSLGGSDSGSTPSTFIQGFIFSTETTFISSNTLTSPTIYSGSVNSNLKGYALGGGQLINSEYVAVNEIQGMRFDTETSINPYSVLTNAAEPNEGVNSSNKGYLISGRSINNRVFGLEFNTESSFVLIDSLPVLNISASAVNSNTVGYIAGGYLSGLLFSTETLLTPVGSLTQDRRLSSGLSSLNKGYICSGGYATNKSIEYLHFATETCVEIVSILTYSSEHGANTANSQNGYIFGNGELMAGSLIHGLNYTTETAVITSSGLGATTGAETGIPRGGVNTVAMVLAKGYLLSGNNGNGVAGTDLINTVQGIVFDTEVTFIVSNTLATTSDLSAGVNSFSRGYRLGASSGSYGEINGLIFDSETTIVPVATLSLRRYALAGVGSASKGYGLAGIVNLSGSNTTEIDGLNYTTETSLNPTTVLSVARNSLTSFNSLTKGYCLGGYSINEVNEIDGILFSTEAAINPSASLIVAKYLLAGVNSTTKGYTMGGWSDNLNIDTATIERFTFSNETNGPVTATLSLARSDLTGVNSHIKGLALGGYGNSISADIDGITLDTESAINSVSTLSIPVYDSAGVQSGGYL
jgi:hypothetical protein